MDDPAATAMFAAKGIDVTPDKDQGVIKVFTSFNFQNVLVCSSVDGTGDVTLDFLTKWKVVSLFAGNKPPRTQWGPTNDWGQSHRPLHWKTAHWEEI